MSPSTYATFSRTLLVASDLASLSICAFISFEWRRKMGGDLLTDWYLGAWPALILFFVAYFTAGLYSNVLMGPVEELRRLTFATTLVFLSLGTSTFMLKQGDAYSRGIYLLAWLLALLCLPIARAGMRAVFARRPWWGESVAIIGSGPVVEAVVETLNKQPSLGLKPRLVLNDTGDPVKGVELAEQIQNAPKVVQKLGISYGIIVAYGMSSDKLAAAIERHTHSLKHVIVIPELFGFSSLWVTARDIAGILGLQVSRRLLLPHYRLAKRGLELFFLLLGAPFALPIMIVIALLIKISSSGPAFYSQARIGRNGQLFRAWKFRTMVPNAEAALGEYLLAHPELREEWDRTHKLRNDPRVTSIGSLLRRTSLDELPQLWNVLKGEMSLVGPRPIVEAEIPKYQDAFEIYLKVTPGLTGLWQISGRSDTTYGERVHLDCYYVRNWSIWLDIYILARTFVVVLFGRGAY